MPLSKKRNRERMRLNRLHKAISTSQTSNPVQPNALQSTTRPLKEESNGKLPIQPGKEDSMVEVIEEWTPKKHTISIDGVVSRVESNPLGMIPIVVLDADGEPIYEVE